jgi:hypothetical protein
LTAEVLLGPFKGFDSGISLFILALELSNAGALLLARPESLSALQLQLVLEPLVILLRKLELLFDRLLSELGTARGCLRFLCGY